MKIARVFPRQNKATPTDSLCFFDGPPLWRVECDEVHISCVFTYDKAKAEYLANQWAQQGYNVKLGGPAYNSPGDEFMPGRYLKQGYTITSRGCNNNCWFCATPKREGSIRELGIKDGYNVLDSNLLQCSDQHIKKVFAMLKQQAHKAQLTGGLESQILKDWHVDSLSELKPETLFFAYDTPSDKEPLIEAASKMYKAGFSRGVTSCYCLIGYPGDTIGKAKERLGLCVALNLMPFAMLYRGQDYKDTGTYWEKFQRKWANRIIVGSRNKGKFGLFFKG